MIDLIIPAYNAHKTMARCLSSICSQTIIEDINVVIVNDNSDKDYSEFVNSFSPYMKIKEVKITENSGPGTARRIGMENSSSEYIIFMDADDTFFDSYSAKNLYKAITENNVDVLSTTFMEEIINEKGETVFITHNRDMIWVFGKIYKRSFLEKYHIEFNDTRANEDNGFNTAVSLLSKRVGFLDNTPTYYWHWNDMSITRNNDYIFNGMEGFIDNQIWAYEIVNKNEHDEKLCVEKMIKNFIMLYYYAINFEDTGRDMAKYYEWCKKYYDTVYVKIRSKVADSYFKQLFVETTKNTELATNVVPKYTIGGFIDILKSI